jgi:hypothetical protein
VQQHAERQPSDGCARERVPHLTHPVHSTGSTRGGVRPAVLSA